MKLLFVASAPMEYSGMLKRMRAQRTEKRGSSCPVDCAGRKPGGRAEALAPLWARSGRMRGHEVLLIANGAGLHRAAAAVDTAAGRFRPDAVVSTGFCGAVDPELEIGQVVIGTSITAADRSYAARQFSSAQNYARGVVVTVDHVVRTAAEKKRLHAQGATIVEMEAAGVACRAEALGLPLFCARAVTDLASEDMANDFNAALREDGQFATMRIFRHALTRPAIRFPELLRLRGNCIRAANTLGEFFADCEF
jgi:adenosylhomocysteine nucleosidase